MLRVCQTWGGGANNTCADNALVLRHWYDIPGAKVSVEMTLMGIQCAHGTEHMNASKRVVRKENPGDRNDTQVYEFHRRTADADNTTCHTVLFIVCPWHAFLEATRVLQPSERLTLVGQDTTMYDSIPPCD